MGVLTAPDRVELLEEVEAFSTHASSCWNQSILLEIPPALAWPQDLKISHARLAGSQN